MVLKGWLFVKINELDKHLPKLEKKEKEHKLMVSEINAGILLQIPWKLRDSNGTL